RLAAIAGGIVSVLAVLLYGTLRGGWLDAILAGITIGMSMLPEEFPVVLAVFMAMGAWRISRARVLTRHAAAIEPLGSATVLCAARQASTGAPVPYAFRELHLHGLRASAPHPFGPTERASHDFAGERFAEADARLSARWTLVHGYGLRPDLLAVTQIWRPDKEG